MRTRWVAVAGLAFVLFASTGWSAERINQKVLYTGDPKSDRTADFRSFLEKHFTRVGLADYLSLRQADTKGYDVIILDWPDLPPRKDGVFKVPALGRDYDRPTILIGGGTLGVGRSQQLKLDDLCLCLGDAAHGIVTTHEIFHTPNEVRLTFENRQVPVYYRSWPIGERLGETMKVWRVQKRGWSAERPEDLSYLPGMVSDPCGFSDSPDCEFMASGLNMKSPEAVAIGRQGNFLLWGFYSPPSDLMPEARQCLVNAICYIKKFDGQSAAGAQDATRCRQRAATGPYLCRRFQDDPGSGMVHRNSARVAPKRPGENCRAPSRAGATVSRLLPRGIAAGIRERP